MKKSIGLFAFVIFLVNSLIGMEFENLRSYCLLGIDKTSFNREEFESQNLLLLEHLAMEIGANCSAATSLALALEEQLNQKILSLTKDEIKKQQLVNYANHLKLQAKHYRSFFKD